MERTILFEGKVTLADKLVDFRIYKDDEEGSISYSYDVNPQVRDASQGGFHVGEIQRADNLERLLFRFNQFQKEFSKIVDMRFNRDY